MENNSRMMELEAAFENACANDDQSKAYDAYHTFKAEMDPMYKPIFEQTVLRIQEKGWYEEFMRGN